MRGYFGIGVEGISKAMNAGSLFRTAQAFGASFVFTIAAQFKEQSRVKSDTSNAVSNLPYYSFPDLASSVLPEDCSIVGVEMTDDAIELPSFHHPKNAVYVLGPERGELSKDLVERCSYVINIPTKFSINVGLAGALVMYDRMITLGRFAPRPVGTGGPTEDLPEHVFGAPKQFGKKMEAFRDEAPQDTYSADETD